MNDKARLYVPIEKTETQEDGTLKVWGYMSTEERDSDKEIIRSAAIKAALPEYLKWGAVREMHANKAAGTAIEASVEEDGRTFFGAHIVDPIAVKKVQSKTYKGFSVGGSVTERDKADKSIITGINLVEVSLVDRPANPGAVFTMYKADGIPGDDDAGGDQTAGDAGDGDELADNPHVSKLADLLDSGKVAPEALLKAAEALIAGDAAGDEADDEPGPDGDVAKSMWSVMRLAELTAEVAGFARCAAYEVEKEGRNVEMPAKVREAATALAAVLQEVVTAEAAAIAAEKAAAAGDVEKAAAPDADAIAKAVADATADLSKSVADLTATVQAQAKQIEDMGKRAAAPRGLLRALSKAQDTGGNEPDGSDPADQSPESVAKRAGVEPVRDARGGIDEVATLIKLSHQHGLAVRETA